MKTILSFVLLAGLAVAQQTGHTTTGTDFRDQCEAAIHHETDIKAGLCIGFLNAYQQLAEMLPPSASVKLECWPNGATPVQIAKIVTKYLDAHPEKLHLPAAQLIYDATYEAFPCPAEKKQQ